MCLISEKTNWLFILTDPKDSAEERHIIDVAYGVFCLESIGIAPEQITLIIDADKDVVSSVMADASEFPYQVHKSAELYDILGNITAENLVIFVTGHGCANGIPVKNGNIKPFPFINAIRKISNLKCGVVYLGQCFAGIFHYSDVQEEKDPTTNKQIAPPVVIVGATNLHESYSGAAKIKFRERERIWSANIFLYCLFFWFVHLADVDGDGKYTVMDSYRFAATYANDSHRNIIVKLYKNLPFLASKVEEAEKAKDAGDTQKLDYVAADAEYRKMLSIVFSRQDSWILNAQVAQKLTYK